MLEMLGQMVWFPVRFMTGCMNAMAASLAGLQPAGDRPCCGRGAVAMPTPTPIAPGASVPEQPWGRTNAAAGDGGANNQSKEEREMSDCNCCCDRGDKTVKLVEYSIVSIKPCDEKIIFKGEEIYTDSMDDEAFAAWVIALYLQSDDHKRIPHDDKKYLRVYQRELYAWPRPCDDCENRQVDVLKEINQSIREVSRHLKNGGAEPATA